MEYEFDEEAEQVQGRLATDNLQPEEPEDAEKAQDPDKLDEEAARDLGDDNGNEQDEDQEMMEEDI